MSNLAELHTEKLRLRAVAAESEINRERAGVVDAAQVRHAARSMRAAVAKALDSFPATCADLLEGEQDAHRIRVTLADACHDILSRIAALLPAAGAAAPACALDYAREVRPRELLTVSTWASKHRWMLTDTAFPGQWDNARSPHLVEIMDDLSEHSPVRTIVVCSASGLGKTETMYNWIGYVMQHLGNATMLAVCGSLDLRNRSFNRRLDKMIAQTPALSSLVSRASRDSANRADMIEFGQGGTLIKAGANSPDSMRSDHLPYVACDEVSTYPWSVGGEGDPLSLLENRQKTFPGAKTLLISTPRKFGQCRITQAWEDSDRRQRHVPCPHCGTYQVLARDRFRWSVDRAHQAAAEGKERALAAWFVCVECGGEIHESDKHAVLPAGRWIADRPHVTDTHGYKIASCYSMPGLGYSWVRLADRLLGAQEDDARLEAVLNTDWAETYKPESDSLDDTALIARREAYTREGLEQAGRLLRVTGWADVQKDRLEMTVIGWGAGEECWVLDHVILPGDTADPDVWEDLGDAMAAANLDRAGVDAGYNTTMVLKFCEARSWCTPTKGIPGSGRALIEDDLKRRQRLRRVRRKGSKTEPIGPDDGKAILFSRLRIAKPGPGYVHFPQAAQIDDEYFAQLTAEELRTVLRKGRKFKEWVQVRPRNEALDCFVGNLAILRLAGPLPKTPPARNKPKQAAALPAVEATDAPATAPQEVVQEPTLRRRPQTTRNPWESRL
jgi:phage terminase large subunit GpA-like protein